MKRTVLALSLMAGVLMMAAPEAAEGQRRQPDRITPEEIDASPHRQLNIHEFIRRTRPGFLEVRGSGGGGSLPIAVYMDGRRQSGVDALKTIPAATVQDVVYFEPQRAAAEFGPQAASGAIVIKLRRDARPD
jgi:hypothetical protein